MSEHSTIGASSAIRGNISGEGSLAILGRVEGDVTVTGDVTVGRSGAVGGSIRAASISVSGAVRGDLLGSESVAIGATGRVIGDLSAAKISIAEGGLVRGRVQTDGTSGASPKRASRSQESARPVARQKPVPREAPAQVPATPPRASAAKPTASQKRPPPPVVPAPRKGAKGRKKVAKRRGR